MERDAVLNETQKRPGSRLLPGARFGSLESPRFGLGRGVARDQRGVAGIEYALICALIALAVVGSVTGLGSKVGRHWSNVDAAVANAG